MAASLDEWQSKSITDESNPRISRLLDMCRCCGRSDCSHLHALAETIRKLEQDTRLAAEIGQALLVKYETSTAECETLKEQMQQRIQEAVTETHQELSKRTWEYHKTRELLEEAASDLETAQASRDTLAKDLSQARDELDTLRAVKVVASEADRRERALQLRLDDAHQELGYLRKKEHTLETNHRTLKERYASLQNECDLTKQALEKSSRRTKHEGWALRERRDGRLDVDDSLPSKGPEDDEDEPSKMSHSQLLALVKELASTNRQLTAELAQCKEQLSETRGEVEALTSAATTAPSSPCRTDNKAPPAMGVRTRQRKVPRSTRVVRSGRRQQHHRPSDSQPGAPQLPKVVHHHYHYHVAQTSPEQGEAAEDPVSGDPCLPDCNLVLSPSSSSSSSHQSDFLTSKYDTPCGHLSELGAAALSHLRASDSRTLNRQLRRAYDMTTLVKKSNSIIDAVQRDVRRMDERLAPTVSAATWDARVAEDFDPLVRLVQDLLLEIAELRITMNDLHKDYVAKMNEKEANLVRTLEAPHTASSPKLSPLTWLSTVFGHPQHMQHEHEGSCSASILSDAASDKTRLSSAPGPPTPIPDVVRTRGHGRRKSSTTVDTSQSRLGHPDWDVSFGWLRSE